MSVWFYNQTYLKNCTTLIERLQVYLMLNVKNLYRLVTGMVK